MKLKKSAGWCRSLLLLSLSAMVSSCGGGGGSNSGGPLSSGSSNIAVTVTPASATLAPGGTQLYTASVTGTTDTTVTWSAGGVQGGNATIGTISSSGLYTAPAAPPNPSNVTITAVSVADSTKSGTAVADIRVHHDNQDPQSGPIKLGTSGGNSTDKTTSGNRVFCCSGTLGSLVSRAGTLYILSNNHVLNKSDQGAVRSPSPDSRTAIAETRESGPWPTCLKLRPSRPAMWTRRWHKLRAVRWIPAERFSISRPPDKPPNPRRLRAWLL